MQQSKVSIVVPCYNKEEYISEFLESVIAQKWDNIELILVNDGSTDGTCEIIRSYGPKMKERGYTIVIIDKENGGCCSAVYQGLLRITGEYMCIVDPDDVIAPEYVSTPVLYLQEHPDTDYTYCDHMDYVIRDGEKVFNGYQSYPIAPEDTYSQEFFLCNDPSKAAWGFITRMSYFRKCRIVENFYIDTRGSYEPSFLIPFSAGGGKMKRIKEPLYFHNGDAGGLSQDKEFEKKMKYWQEYHRVVLLMLDRVDGLDKYRKHYLKELSVFYTDKILYIHSIHMQGGRSYQEELRQNLLLFVNHQLSVFPPVTYKQVCENYESFCRALEMALNGLWDTIPTTKGRVIIYGALGRVGKRLLPCISDSSLSRMEFWDQAGDGKTILKPNFQSLTEEDIVVVLPISREIVDSVSASCEASKAKLVHRDRFLDLAAKLEFPQFESIVLR